MLYITSFVGYPVGWLMNEYIKELILNQLTNKPVN